MPSSRLLFDDESVPRPRASRWRLLWRLLVIVVFAAWSILLIAWLALHWGILPNARAWLPQIEHQVGRALGAPVRIGDIRVQSGRWVPALELDDVVLFDRDRREVLRLPRVAAVPAVDSLLAFELRLLQLHVAGAELEVRRDALGSIHVAGFAVDAGGGDGGALADWFFRQREIVVRGARLRWVDEQRLAPPLELGAVDLVVRNGLRTHEFRLDATPPAEWGQRFSLRGRFSAPLLGDRGDWRRWVGSVYAELPQVDAAQLRHHVPLPFEWTEGEGALRAWVDLDRGEATAATADVALRDVALRLAPTVEPLALRELQGRIVASRDADALTLAATDFGFTDADGREWPRGDLQLTLHRRHGAGDAPVTGGELRADRLDLALVAAVARRVPVGEAVRGLLDDLRPTGTVEPLQLRWGGPPDDPTQYRVQATARDLAIAPRPAPEAGGVGRPGWSGASIDLDATERGGRAQVAITRGALVLPGVFERPEVALDRFGASLGWRLEPRDSGQPPRIEVKVDDARFANADARGSFTATWRTGDGEGVGRGGRHPGRLELRGRLDAARADAVAHYLPLGLPQATRHYVGHAVRGGRLSEGRFRVDGDLADFPFTGPGEGVFRVTARAEAIDLAYVPDEPGWSSPWPPFSAVSGDLEFDRASMAVRNGVARFQGVELSAVEATIADMVGASVLQIDGVAQGPTSDLLRYVATSPVGGWLDDALAQATAGGRGRLRLSLRVPLGDTQASTVGGVLTLAGNDLRLGPDVPPLADVRGDVEFTDRGWTLRDVRAQVFGGEAVIDGGTGADGALRLAARGRASAEALRAQDQFPALAGAAAVLAGTAAYRLQLDWSDEASDAPAIDLASDLVGVSVDLPAPLGKPAAAALPLHLRIVPLPAAAPRWRDEVQLTLGAQLAAHALRDGEGERVSVRSAGIGVGEAAPRPQAGVAARLTLDELDLDAWRAAAGRLGAGTGGDAAAYAPQQIGLRVGVLRAEGRELTGLVAELQRTPADGPWRGRVDADQLAGTVEWRAGRDGVSPGGLRARLTRLHVPPADADPVETWLDRSPATVPALDVVVDDFRVGGKDLGRLEVEAVNRPLPAGSAHEWQLSRLQLGNADARFAATGRWRPAAAATPARMAADFRLELVDGGALLARLGMPGALRGGRGELAGEVSWQGSPLAPHPPSMNGQLKLALRSGKFLQADSGAARVLSVLSLQALPRRLTLDFRDVFEEGFEFDEASGDVTIADGVARTANLRMRGLQAGVLMEGEADLAHETQDLRVIVVPEINAGTASLLYSIINPVIGVGTFVAQLFLRQPLMQAGTREFHVSGSWADPQVERVERVVEAAPSPAQ